MAGNQKQLSSTQTKERRNWQSGKSRHQAKTCSIREPHIAEHQINSHRVNQFVGHADTAGKVASETPPAHPVRQGLGIMETRSDQQHVDPRDCHELHTALSQNSHSGLPSG
jgi:hypothetical protein